MRHNSSLEVEDSEEKRLIVSSRFGEIEYSMSDIINLVIPLYGFDRLKVFILLKNTKIFPLAWFQSVEKPEISFMMVDLKAYFSGYNPEVRKMDLRSLGAQCNDDIVIYGIVVVKSPKEKSTVNLKAPVIINLQKRLAKQLILENSNFLVKTPLFGKRDADTKKED